MVRLLLLLGVLSQASVLSQVRAASHGGQAGMTLGCGSKNGKFAGSLKPEVNRVGGIPQWLRLFASKMDKTPSQNKMHPHKSKPQGRMAQSE